MWTLNGAETLPCVLKRIGEVIPSSSVNKRVIIDDGSLDNTREIAHSFGWQVFANEGNGISDGASTALKHVESERFASFEQDLLLSKDWWRRIPAHLNHPRVVVASGIRLPNQPLALRKIQEYVVERYQSSPGSESFLYGKTLDNTIYKTEAVRSLGGFPKLSVSAGVDNILAKQVSLHDLEWKVDFAVKSTHLRKGLKQELSHYYWYGTCSVSLDPLLFKRNVNLNAMILRFLFSPTRGLEIAIKKTSVIAIIYYPLLRFAILKGVIDGLEQRASHVQKENNSGS
jgi:glycosyltransferase involved in cell wall biosynthesis